MPPLLEQFLQQTIGLHQNEMRDAASGKAVVKELDTPDYREIAIFGIVTVGVPRSFYVHRVADFPSSLRASSRPRFATFSDSAVASDVASLSLSHDDAKELTHCRPGSCNLKLSATAIAQIRPI